MSNDNMPELTMPYILQKLDQIAGGTAYLHETIAALGELKPDHRFADSPEGDNVSVVKAQALGSVVKTRETTNQQLIALYAQMYKDLRGPLDEKAEQLRQIVDIMKEVGPQNMYPIKRVAEKMLGLPLDDEDEE